MADLKNQARELSAAISAKKAEAAAAWNEFDGLRKSAVAENVDFANNADAFAKLDAAGKSYDAIRDEVASMEGKRARLLELAGDSAADLGEAKSADRPRSFGEAFVKSEAYKAAAARVGSSDSLPLGVTEGVKVMDRNEAKTLVSVTIGSGTAALAGAPVADRTGLIVAKPLGALDFLSMISTGTTNSDLVEWLEETTYTNNAAGTAEYSAAPESALAFTVRNAAVKEVNHFIPVTRRSMSDAAFIESWINNRLIDGVRRKLQSQVLSGGGTGDDFTGIYSTSGIGSVDRSVTSLNMEDSLHKCITTIRVNAFQNPDFIGINPEDYETIRLRKDTVGGYILGGPANAGTTTLWGIPLVVDAAFTAGSPLVGVAREASLWLREGVSVAASDSHSDYFVNRKVAILGSLRAAFGVTQPKAFAVSVA